MTQFLPPAILPPSCLSLANIASWSSAPAGFFSIAVPKAGNSVATCALHDLGPRLISINFRINAKVRDATCCTKKGLEFTAGL